MGFGVGPGVGVVSSRRTDGVYDVPRGPRPKRVVEELPRRGPGEGGTVREPCEPGLDVVKVGTRSAVQGPPGTRSGVAGLGVGDRRLPRRGPESPGVRRGSGPGVNTPGPEGVGPPRTPGWPRPLGRLATVRDPHTDVVPWGRLHRRFGLGRDMSSIISPSCPVSCPSRTELPFVSEVSFAPLNLGLSWMT